MPNQNPKQVARDKIDLMLIASGWIVQSKKRAELECGLRRCHLGISVPKK